MHVSFVNFIIKRWQSPETTLLRDLDLCAYFSFLITWIYMHIIFRNGVILVIILFLLHRQCYNGSFFINILHSWESLYDTEYILRDGMLSWRVWAQKILGDSPNLRLTLGQCIHLTLDSSPVSFTVSFISV